MFTSFVLTHKGCCGVALMLISSLTVLVIILESRALNNLTADDDVHDQHPLLKNKLSPGDKCWKDEPSAIVQECDYCTDTEKANKDPLVCVATGKKELVECTTSMKRTHRSCEKVRWAEERHFWTFEALLSLFGFFSALGVFIRQKQLDHKMYQRIQKQIAAGV